MAKQCHCIVSILEQKHCGYFHDFAIFPIDLKDKAIWYFEGNMSNINSVQIKCDLKVSNCDAMWMLMVFTLC